MRSPRWRAALGVRIAIENHGGVDLLAREMRILVEKAGPDYVGVCLDTGNPAFAGEDPVLTTALLAPYTATSHVRDNRIWAVSGGAMAQWVPLGEGNTDLHRIVVMLADQAPEATVHLEIITGESPKPILYADPDGPFWRMYPDILARDFARFVTLAAVGESVPFDQVVLQPGRWNAASGAMRERLQAQQRRHVAASVRYSRQVLGIGERGR